MEPGDNVSHDHTAGSSESVGGHGSAPANPVPPEQPAQPEMAIPPYDPAYAPFWEMMQKMMSGQRTSASQHTLNIDKNFAEVRKQGAKVFEGSTDPAEADDWLRHTERILTRMRCTPEQKLRYTTSLLEKSAWSWWESVPDSQKDPPTLTWDDFLKKFAVKYTPQHYLTKKKIEFLELKQKEMTVVEYEAEFTKLSRYAPEDVDTDQKRRDRFERGLRYEIRNRIALKQATYELLLEAAIRAE